MFEEALDQVTRNSLALLNKLALINDFYLAGGTAAALQLGHRHSYDLDFFTPKSFDQQRLVEELAKLGRLGVGQAETDTFLGTLNECKISFFRYPYPLLFPTKHLRNIKIADIKDIGVSKLDAISRRGRKRDFIDLYFIAQEVVPIEKLLTLLDKKFVNLDINKTHVIKSLNYFVDAETDPMPEMIKPISWREVKRFFEEEVKKLAKSYGIKP